MLERIAGNGVRTIIGFARSSEPMEAISAASTGRYLD